jgi:hypothetical protein
MRRIQDRPASQNRDVHSVSVSWVLSVVKDPGPYGVLSQGSRQSREAPKVRLPVGLISRPPWNNEVKIVLMRLLMHREGDGPPEPQTNLRFGGSHTLPSGLSSWKPIKMSPGVFSLCRRYGDPFAPLTGLARQPAGSRGAAPEDPWSTFPRAFRHTRLSGALPSTNNRPS